MKTSFLLVTCCLDQSRKDILDCVVENLRVQAPEILDTITVFDNASKMPGTTELLTSTFKNVYQSDRNVGYWSAIDWWLEHLRLQFLTDKPVPYTYIIESDIMHYAFQKIWKCESYLDTHPHVGSVRLLEYSIADAHLYNKDKPLPNSRRNLWQVHTNRVTGELVLLGEPIDEIAETTFLTQLGALNRYEGIRNAFSELVKMKNFSELDFQALYWSQYQKTAVLDGGIMNCDLNPYGTKAVTGSWTPEQELLKLGYFPTRKATITPRDQYTVTKL